MFTVKKLQINQKKKKGSHTDLIQKRPDVVC